MPTKHYYVLGSNPKEVARMMNSMYPDHHYTHIHDSHQWLSLTPDERTHILFTDTEWYKGNRALSSLVTKHFKEVMRDDPTLIDADAMKVFMPQPVPVPTPTTPPAGTKMIHTAPQEFLMSVLPERTEDLTILEADFTIVPGETPSLTMKVLLPVKDAYDTN